MDIGIPRERRDYDFRVGLPPAGVGLLCEAGHRVYVEHNAGIGGGFTDDEYVKAGATLVYSTEEVYGRAEMIVKVSRPTTQEFDLLSEGQILLGFLHLPVAQRNKVDTLLKKRVTAIAYETIQADDGSLPVLIPMSQIAGRMAAQVAARLLENPAGKGTLLGGVPGVSPAEVVILGAGVLGSNAARTFHGLGAKVFVLDKDLSRLQRLDEMLRGVVTMVSHPFNIDKVVRFADVLLGAILVPGQRAPLIVTREQVRKMRPRSVILDLSVDQGGCVETTRPTTHGSPTYIEEGVIHYCVPNMTGVVGRTATHAISVAAWPFIREIANQGLEAALAADPALARGVNTMNGSIVHPGLAAAYSAQPLANEDKQR